MKEKLLAKKEMLENNIKSLQDRGNQLNSLINEVNRNILASQGALEITEEFIKEYETLKIIESDGESSKK